MKNRLNQVRCSGLAAFIALVVLASEHAQADRFKPPIRLDEQSARQPSSLQKVGHSTVMPSTKPQQPNRCASGDSCRCSNPDFWIVSTRACPQRCGLLKRRPHCCFEHFHYSGGTSVHKTDGAAFQAWLKPNVPTCIVVHGVFTAFDDLLEESCQLYRWLQAADPNRPLNVVIFTWPSDDYPTGILPIDYTVMSRRSEFNGFYLSQFLAYIPPGRRVSLLGHSLGVRTIASFLHLEGGGTVQGQRLCHVNPCMHRMRAVFLASAVQHDWLNPGNRYGNALCRIEALLNIYNSDDLALSFYPLARPFGGHALGRAGFSEKDVASMDWQAAKIAQLEASSLLKTHHLWLYYFEQPYLASAASPYLYFSDDDTKVPPQPSPQTSADSTKRSSQRTTQPVRETYSKIRRVSSQSHRERR